MTNFRSVLIAAASSFFCFSSNSSCFARARLSCQISYAAYAIVGVATDSRPSPSPRASCSPVPPALPVFADQTFQPDQGRPKGDDHIGNLRSYVWQSQKGAETKKVIDLTVFRRVFNLAVLVNSIFPCRDTKTKICGQSQRCTTRKALRSLPSLPVALFAVVLLQRTWMEGGETCWKQPNSCKTKERLIIIVQELFNDLWGHFFRTRWFCLSIHRRSWKCSQCHSHSNCTSHVFIKCAVHRVTPSNSACHKSPHTNGWLYCIPKRQGHIRPYLRSSRNSASSRLYLCWSWCKSGLQLVRINNAARLPIP